MISSLPCSSTTEKATCTGSSGEFCLVKWTNFTLRVSCSGGCIGIVFSLVPGWDSLQSRKGSELVQSKGSAYSWKPALPMRIFLGHSLYAWQLARYVWPKTKHEL